MFNKIKYAENCTDQIKVSRWSFCVTFDHFLRKQQFLSRHSRYQKLTRAQNQIIIAKLNLLI